ncbi:TcpE family conjugal transfer membrane protein [Enterococcus faecalis]|uniref:TcpE family conjugal transfer membrane protein n=1 Tax=Enterococcus faecalis TaxID=1351 RepID=UPI001AD7C924|nr:TcpE family conjugal transfer membrane protein [Enterococcus faecalis]
MKEKQIKYVFDYREPFNAPTMVRELTKKFKLSRAYASQDIIVAMGTCVVLGLFFWKIAFGLNRFTILFTGLCGYGVVTLLNRYEPEGKAPFKFIYDYVLYLWEWQLPKWSFYHDEKVKVTHEKCVYEPEKVSDFMIVEELLPMTYFPMIRIHDELRKIDRFRMSDRSVDFTERYYLRTKNLKSESSVWLDLIRMNQKK